MEVKGSDLQREITHLRYKYKNKIKLGSEKDGWLPKVIDEQFNPKTGQDYLFVSDEFIKLPTIEKIPIYWGGGLTFLLTLFFTIVWIKVGDLFWFPALLYIFSICHTIFSVVAYFTLPSKEIIINRKDGLITFPGWYWIDNVTMRFADIKFGYTSGGPNLIGGYMLQILRPDRFGTFDPFREKDFQRRKREKFPPPLYPASIPTPEATPAQQKEREKYWRG